MPVTISDEDFDEIVGEALDGVPPEFLNRMVNVAITVDDEPPPGQNLLGLYEGIPLPERDGGWAYGALPDKITIFRGPLKRISSSVDHLRHEIRVTVVHEIAHHFGIDDDRLHELGWG